MAHKKGAGSTRNGRDSHSKRLGVKLFGGQNALNGNIIIRQRGTKFYPGEGVDIGKDHTIYAVMDGVVTFKKARKNRTYVHVLPTNNGTEVIEEAPKKVKEETAKESPEAPKIEAKAEESKAEAPKETKAEEPKAEESKEKETKATKAEETSNETKEVKKEKKEKKETKEKKAKATPKAEKKADSPAKDKKAEDTEDAEEKPE